MPTQSRPRFSPFCSFLCQCAVLPFLLAGCRNSGQEANSLVGSPSGAREVSFKTADGWDIFADLYVPKGTSKGAVIFLHQRNGAASDWLPWPRRCKARAIPRFP